MKLFDNQKKKTDNSTDNSEKKNRLEKAGMKLTDDELNMVAGGGAAGKAEKVTHKVIK